MIFAALTTLVTAAVACGSKAPPPRETSRATPTSARPTWNISASEAYQGRSEDDAGCAQYGYVFTDEAPHRISDHVPFAIGSAAVPADAKATLDKIAVQLNDPHPKVVRLAVLGYSTTGEDRVLAQGRANAVLGELLARGVPSNRIESHAVKGELPPGLPRAAVVFEVLVEYRGGIQRWADGGLVACAPNDTSLDCAIPPEAMRTCIRKPK
ncbi:hypothetical protein LZC95_18655 [Pendulispora brunnea]|uniref:OmpA-like domain-containing protein n=1 Tax=Pendulispora brunnea TaxID=2905690 RepID=A0ABZ2KJW0_9BACT